MSVQSEFKEFHNRIKLDYDVRSELADKRDILMKKLRDSGKLPGFDTYDHVHPVPVPGKKV